MGHTVYAYDPAVKKLNGVRITESPFTHTTDAVLICTPSERHAQDLTQVVARCLHCFIEKPIGANAMQVESIASMIKYAKKHCRVLMVGNNLRFHACVLKTQEQLKKIGKLRWANFTCAQYTAKNPYLRDGVTLNWGAHEIDLALHLLGPGKVTGASIEGDGIADILISHTNGCRTAVHLDYWTRRERRGFFISGDGGQIEVDLPSRTFGFYEEDNYTIETMSGSYDSDYKLEMEAFIARINGINAIGASGEDGLAALNLILEAKRASK